MTVMIEPTVGPIDMGEGYGLPDTAGVDHKPWPDVLAAIRDARNWWICTTRASGRAHAMPVWGVVIDQRILWSTSPASVKSANLRRQPEMVMHLESGDDVVIVEARAEEITVDDLPASFVQVYSDKYGFEIDLSEPGYGLWELHPSVVLVWEEARFPETVARWEM